MLSSPDITLIIVTLALLVRVSTLNPDEVAISNDPVGGEYAKSDVEHTSFDANSLADSQLEPGPEKRFRKWRPSHSRHRRAKDDGVCELEISCGGRGEDRASSGVVRLPIRGQRGPPGPPGPPGERGLKGPDRTNAWEAAGASNTLLRKVAFFVGLSENMGPVTENTDVRFDQVITNVGGAFNEASGKFVAPMDGVYQFNVVISAQGRQKAAVMVLKNGEMVTTVWAESIPSWGTSSNVAVLQLTKGDRIWVSLLSRASYLHGYMYTTFSGILVFDI